MTTLSITIRVSPWLARLRFPLVLALAFGGRLGERLVGWVVAKSVYVEGPAR